MSEPVIVVKFQKGLAERNRLPLGHVLSILEEIKQMITSVGKDIQKQEGASDATGDFGLEIVAGRGGLIFKKGSVETHIAITRNVHAGLLAANSVLGTVEKLTRQPSGPTEKFQGSPVEQKIVRHLDRIAKIQTTDKTETKLTVKRVKDDSPDRPVKYSALFGQRAMESVKAVRVPAFTAEQVTLFGRLFELKDRNQESNSKRFWGELRLDNGEVWRVRFDSNQEAQVRGLFRQQVQLTGKAYYYEAYPPKIVPSFIDKDEDRDYEAAFDELFGSEKQQFAGDFNALLKEMHGE